MIVSGSQSFSESGETRMRTNWFGNRQANHNRLFRGPVRVDADRYSLDRLRSD